VLRTDGSADRGIGGSADRGIGGSADRGIGGSRDRGIGGWADRWIDGSIVRWIDGFVLFAEATIRRSVDPPIRRSAAFTLIEMLVVILVISVLAGLVGPMVFRNVGDAKSQAARAQIELLGLALDAYRLDNGDYPTTEQGLAALWREPTVAPVPSRWRGPYTRKTIPLDPWDRAYVYRAPGTEMPTGYDLVSFGRDGQPGGEGEDADVLSWENRR
jgi:general secretion pathway protein G